MYYLCGDLSEADLIRSVQMRVISETQPESHLRTLIYRDLLDEAEKFAIEYKLSLQPVYEARARLFVSQFGNASVDDEKFNEFLKIANLITNEEFLLKLRDMEIQDRNVMKRLLEFLLERIVSKVTFRK